jgi:Fe(3+) dicitrate transport protein
VCTTYALVDANIREPGGNHGNPVPFSAQHEGNPARRYSNDTWKLNVDGESRSGQFADHQNTVTESADGGTRQLYDDNDNGKYIGQPRTVYPETFVAF